MHLPYLAESIQHTLDLILAARALESYDTGTGSGYMDGAIERLEELHAEISTQIEGDSAKPAANVE